ncbi:MAG: DUF4910 domain-containing protein [candidate division WOR-3 bacterium]
MNFKEIISVSQKNFPSSFIISIINDFSRFHRIQVSEEYSKALSELSYLLKNEGINFKIHKLPFNKNSEYFFQKFFPYWKINKGYLKIIEPFIEIIADYREIPLSVIPRSKKVGGIYEIVDFEKYKGEKDKKIFLTENFRKTFYEILGNDAGILYFGMPEIEGIREEGELEDYLHYVSFWEEGFFGFSISKRKGEKLKKVLKKHKKLKAEVEIFSEFGEGFIEIVDILFKGEEDKKEIWLLSHFCHPSPFANDNLSGVAVSLGIAKYINELIKKNEIKLKRNLRILILPEMTGTIAFLKEFFNENIEVISALNLDMVGEDQDKCKSVMTVEREPFFIRSFAGYLAGLIMDYLPGGAKNFRGTSEIPLFRKTMSNYSGGSDHYILISPDFGIPSCMINYWPDKFYHTTADTRDKISEISLKNSFSLAYAYLYFLLNFEKEDVLFLKEKIKEIFKREIFELKIKEGKKEEFIKEYFGLINAFKSLNKLEKNISIEDDLKEIEEFMEKEKIKKEKSERIKTKEKFILRKKEKGVPLSLSFRLDFKERKIFDEKREKIKNLPLLIDLISYLADGKRDFEEILNFLNLEIGKLKIKDIHFVIDILEKIKFMEKI